ncbi:hypothetical protein Tco_1306026 [Tanacetum coccineum]
MSSDPNYEWEQLLVIDDSDSLFSIPATATIILDPTGIFQLAKLRKQLDDSVLSTQEYIKRVVEDVGEDEDFKSGSWVSADYVNANDDTVSGCLGDIKNFLKNGKHEQVVAIIKSCTLNALGDLTVTMKDLSGSALILANVSIFSPKPSMHYLNITMRNVVKVFHKDSVPGNDNGVGGSKMLMEEETIFDEEALDFALEEEARQARAYQEWLEKCRQEDELDEEHERQL